MIARGAVLDVSHERLLDDVALAAELGLTVVRIDVPWVAAQPRAGGFDGDVFERCHTAATVARAAGVTPWFRLLQPAIPHWFDDEGGLTDDRTTATWWPRWVELVTEHLGDVAGGWVPFEAPFGMVQRIHPGDPRKQGELMRTLVVAWRDAWRILRGPVPVATSLDVAVERPADDTPPARMEARRRDQLRWDVWLRGFADGVARIPGRADELVPDLQGAVDVLGLALRMDVETSCYRVHEFGLGRPLAVTVRPVGDTDGDRARHLTAVWRELTRAAGDLPLTTVLVTPFADRPGAPGIVTDDRELKDSGEAFVHPG